MPATSNNYPRALPYHSSEELAMHTARLRRWTCYLLTAGAGMVIVIIAAAVFLFNQARGAGEPVAAVSPDDSTTAKPQAPKPAPASKERESKPVAAAPAKASAVLPGKERFLEALGGLSAAHLYQSYLNIGLLADGVESEAYAMDEAEKLLASVTDLMNLVDAQLAKIAQMDLDVEDHASLERIKAVSGLLRLQKTALQTYWASGESDDATRYHKTREAAWTGLSKVLGFDE